ncbi:hypothetical protein [Spirosoma soli]|uniref:hypothetical protein n=1 Tax=Spirosoma soli TaxID=1770529 RepID=UPI0036D2D6A3
MPVTWFGQSRAGGSPGSSGRVGGSPDLFYDLPKLEDLPSVVTRNGYFQKSLIKFA